MSISTAVCSWMVPLYLSCGGGLHKMKNSTRRQTKQLLCTYVGGNIDVFKSQIAH